MVITIQQKHSPQHKNQELGIGHRVAIAWSVLPQPASPQLPSFLPSCVCASTRSAHPDFAIVDPSKGELFKQSFDENDFELRSANLTETERRACPVGAWDAQFSKRVVASEM
ncbi:hypothetical protein BLNAU_20642 [Blattamonas nauphoetae]|uniref:Uncharacterized protein n=1 Tax=Blattamonas nauphoetae TaxID=2049346 RepID=A0ABQ9WY45_9EUKA|nr:hypothetical protein BLNAU_20642 [Blattamonas nauphoetae]